MRGRSLPQVTGDGCCLLFISISLAMVARTGNTPVVQPLELRSCCVSLEYSAISLAHIPCHWTLSLFGSRTKQVFNRPKLESMSQDLPCLVVAILVKVVPYRGVLFVVLILWAVFCAFVFAVYWRLLCLWKWRHELFPNRENTVLSN